MVNVNAFRVVFRVVGPDGQPIPSLSVHGPWESGTTTPVDVSAGGTVSVAVSVVNDNNGSFRIVDSVPRLQSGSPVVTSAAAAFDAPIGTTSGSVSFSIRSDARIGDEGDYLVDLVAEAV